MAHFYGTLKGKGKEITRTGTKNSGLETYTASWEGAVRTSLWHNKEEGRDYCRVSLVKWQGKGTYQLLYTGPVSGDIRH